MLLTIRRSYADLSLTTPLDCCCNCGAKGQIKLIDTPLAKTSHLLSPLFILFVFGGGIITYRESFPYCKRCAESAKRVRAGWFHKAVRLCLVLAIVFLLTVLAAPVLPALLAANLFRLSVSLVAFYHLLHFCWIKRMEKGRSYYQPVWATKLTIEHAGLHHIRLKFYNAAYARIFARANAELIAASLLKVEIQK